MDLTSKSTIIGLLAKYRGRPSKGLGQNFLVDKAALCKTIEAAGLTPQDIVLEIGPGIGNLTRELAKKAKRVIAVEKDEKMVEILKETLKDYKNVKIIQDDILKSQILITNDQPNPNSESSKKNKIGHWGLGIGHYKVVANLPYYITSPVIRKFLECENPPELMVLMIQKEVAQRICAKPPHRRQGYGGQAKMNLLAVSVQFYAEPNIVSYVSKKSFWPQPKVDGAILKISAFNQYKNSTFCQWFFKIVKAGFCHPRKQLANNLAKGLKLDKSFTFSGEKVKGKERVKLWLLKNNILPNQRAETLSVADWIKLTKSYVLIVK